MRQQLRTSAVTLALLLGVGFAAAQNAPSTTPGTAQGPLHLTEDQKHAVIQGLKGEQTQSSPADAQPQVGSRAPDSTTMHQLPNDVASQVPETKTYLFVKLPDRVLLIDPESKMVAEMIMESDAMSSGPGSSDNNRSNPGTGPSGGPGTAR
jgi:hypothetical protein